MAVSKTKPAVPKVAGAGKTNAAAPKAAGAGKTKPAAPAKPAAGKAKPAAPAKPAPAGQGGVVEDKALKARWTEAIERYRKARGDEAAGWDERYEALGEILDSDPPYYLAGGFKDARAFLEVEAPDQDERSVRRSIRVARYFDPDDETKYGISRLDLLLDYLEAAGGAPLAPAKIRVEKQKVRVPSGKTSRLAPFSELTQDELRQAVRLARSKTGPAAATAAKEPPVVKVVRSALGKAGLSALAVRLRQGRLDVSGIPLDKLGALAKVLAAVKLPDAG